MYETPIAVVGRIVNDPRRRDTGNSDVVKFRVASNSRRRADDGSWVTGETLFVNVNCWGRLVTGVAASLKKGDAVIVVGHLYTSEYDDRDGQHRSSLELRATAVGPDLNRYITRLEKHGVPAEPARAGDRGEEHDRVAAQRDVARELLTLIGGERRRGRVEDDGAERRQVDREAREVGGGVGRGRRGVRGRRHGV